ncbi:MAG: protoheme IX farnesyltransferase [candidate division Zixibacteria bacterium]|nr:protoheme IX farnesyltransferase [candidate division Zixibacteria bacterium]
MNFPLSSYIQLTKPSIMLLVLAGGLTGIIMEGSLLEEPLKLSLFLLGLFLTGGCANALNQYFEREIDARMSRTSSRRPLPLRKLTPLKALLFSIFIGLAGILILGLVFNWLTAFLATATILFYGLVYTLWLKPSTSLNIVIGGVAGAMAPVGAWAAATGEIALTPWLVFLIIFFWTPPHFWSLAIRFNDDYRAARLPMLPLVKGRETALKQIYYYTLALFGVSLLPLAVRFGWFYLFAATVLGMVFIGKTYAARKSGDINKIWGVFKYSIVYLFALFAALIINGII